MATIPTMQVEHKLVTRLEIFDYLEVFEITEWKDGCIFKTKRTDSYIHRNDVHHLNMNMFSVSAPSTKVLRVEKQTIFIRTFK